MSESEATQRAAVCAIAKGWLGTPFRDQGKVKGPHGAVDCAMLLVAVFQEAGLLDPDFDPRPYLPQWHLHRSEERFLAVVSKLGREVPNPSGLPAEALAKAGDVIVYRVARCFSHGGIALRQAQGEGGADAVLHAYYKTGCVALSSLAETELALLPDGKPRPFKLFDMWADKGPTP